MKEQERPLSISCSQVTWINAPKLEAGGKQPPAWSFGMVELGAFFVEG